MSIAADNRIAALEARVARLEALISSPAVIYDPADGSLRPPQSPSAINRTYRTSAAKPPKRRGRPPKKSKAAA